MTISDEKTQFVILAGSSRIETLRKLKEFSPFMGIVIYRNGDSREGLIWVGSCGLKANILNMRVDKEFKVNLEKVERIEVKVSMSTNLDGHRRAISPEEAIDNDGKR